MEWTVEDNMVDGLFYCATLTGRTGSHTLRRRLSRTQALLVNVIPGGWVPVSGMKMRSLVGLSVHSAMLTSKIITEIIENHSEFSGCANSCNKFVSNRS